MVLTLIVALAAPVADRRAAAAAPSIANTLLASFNCGKFEGCGITGNVTSHDTVLAARQGAIVNGQLVAPTNARSTPGMDFNDVGFMSVNSDDTVVGWDISADNTKNEPIVWQAGNDAYRLLDFSSLGWASTDNVEATLIDDDGEIAGTDLSTGQSFYMASATAPAVTVPVPPGASGPASIQAMNTDWEIVYAGGLLFRLDRAHDTYAELTGPASGTASWLAADGTAVAHGEVIFPDGTTRPTQLSYVLGISDDHALVGEGFVGDGTSPSQNGVFEIDPEGNAINLGDGTGHDLIRATIAPNGDIVGETFESDRTVDVYLVKASTDTVTGTVVDGPRPGQQSTPTTPEKGIKVTVAGHTAGGESFSKHVTTRTDGSYGVEAPAGTYTVTFPADVCALDGTVKCHSTKAAVVDDALDPVTVDAIELQGQLTVTVSPSPQHVTLKVDPKTGDIVPAAVTVTVEITNSGAKPVTNVTAPDKLVVGYSDPNDVHVDKVSFRLKKGAGPKPKADLGTLKPHKTVPVTYAYQAQGDGKYSVEALILGANSHGRTIRGLAKATEFIGSPVLEMSTEMGRKVKSPDDPGLVLAGTAFTINVTFENKSNVKTVEVDPYVPQYGGNASDVHLQRLDDPIQNVQHSSAEDISEAVELDPGEKKKLALVVRTTGTPADTLVGEQATGGGTRAELNFVDPVAYVLDTKTKTTTPLDDAAIYTHGESKYSISLDDADHRPEPEEGTLAGTAYYFTVGMLHGLRNITTGMLSGLFVELPKLLAKGIANVPTALTTYVSAEMDLWNSIKDDPAEVAAFTNLVGNTMLLAYKNAPELIDNEEKFRKAITKDVLDGYTRTWNDWYGGNRGDALEEFGREFTERSGDLAMAIAPGLLARDAAVLDAFKSTEAKVFDQTAAGLKSAESSLVDANEAMELLKNVVKPGYEMSNTVLQKVFGLRSVETDFLRQFAQSNKLLIVVRSRAAESVEWIEKLGAVLKPESIKLKNVAWLDVKYLGYSVSDVGRVVIRKALPTVAEVEAKLRKAGFTDASAEWIETIKRLKTRTKELTTSDKGYVDQLEKAAKDGHIDMKWNFAENSVDPTAYTDSSTRYRFRMATSAHGDQVPQFFVKGQWRCITGDVDFLQITQANGAPLADAERVRIYGELAKSVVGLLHPESATWTDLAHDAFNFDTKINEFERAGTVAQFAPDGIVRGVDFNKELSSFVSKRDYSIFWDGGYRYPLGTMRP
jgi:hypothetical protein